MNVPHFTVAPYATAAEAVADTQDQLELVVFNMADATRPGGVIQLADEYGVQAFA